MPKDNFFKVRITEEEKQIVREFCEKNGLTISGMMRYLLFKAINEDKENKNETN